MSLLLILLAFTAALAACFVLLVAGRRRHRHHPVAGTILHQLLNYHRIADYQTELARRHRTFRMLAPGCSLVYTAEPANVEHILKTNFANYGKGKMTHDIMVDLLGDGIFAVDGDKWRQQRKIASVEFSTKMLRDYSTGVFRRTAARLSGIVAGAAASGAAIEIQELLARATLDSMFEVAFGVELNSLDGGGAVGEGFAEAFDSASRQLLYRFVDVLWKVKRALNLGAEKTMKKNIMVIDGFVYAVVDKKMEARGELEIKKGDDIVSRFLAEREVNPDAGIDRKYLRDIMLSFILAGKDTTSVTLAWFIYRLCRHRHIQDKAAAEAAATGEADGLAEEALNSMHYLHAALTETLRLHPAVPVDVKCCFADDTLPDGFTVKKGDMVHYMPYAMGRMEFLWGADAEDFRPERWLDSEGVFLAASPFKFSAFQAGPRICLGKEFAYRQMKIFAAVLLQGFRFELWDEAAPVRGQTMLTLQIDGGLRVRAMPRTRFR